MTSGDFAATNACSSSLAPHSSCAITVTFVPTAVGTRNGTLTVSDQVRTQTVTLSGMGIAPAGVSLTPQTVSFGAIGVGLSGSTQIVTLSNNGGGPLALTAPAVSGDFSIASSTCGPSVGVASTCSFVVAFTPTAAGPRTGTLTLTDNAPSGTQTVALSGTGIDFTLAPNGATAVSTATGGSATFPLTLNSLAGLTGNVAFTCSGAPANSICTVSPASAALGTSVQVSAVVQTGMTTAVAEPFRPWQPRERDGLLFATVPFVWFGLRRRRKALAGVRQRGPTPLVLLALCLAISGSLSGCGSSRQIPFAGSTGGGSGGDNVAAPTPPGTYAITVSGTTAGVTHQVALTLTVQ